MHDIIQVAGIIDAVEARLLEEENVDWLGFPLRLPSGKNDISEPDASDIIRHLRPTHTGVLITYMTDAESAAALCRDLGCGGVQFHGVLAAHHARHRARRRQER